MPGTGETGGKDGHVSCPQEALVLSGGRGVDDRHANSELTSSILYSSRPRGWETL